MLTFRRLLSPLLLRVHPDLFAQSPQHIRTANLLCVQRINALTENIECLYEGGLVRRPLEPRYTFHCFLRGDASPVTGTRATVASAQGDVAIKEVRLEVRTPDELTRSARMPLAALTRGLQEFCHGFGVLFGEAGLDNPWPPPQAEQVVSGGRGGDEDQWRRLAHKRALLRVAELQVRHRVSPFQPDDTHNPGTTPRLTPHLRVSLVEAVDSYIANGHVLVDRGMSPGEELAAVRRMRAFLLEYGEVVAFDLASWWRVLFVLRGNTDSHSHSSSYTCRTVSGRRVIEVPVRFRPRLLLDCIAEHVPDADAACTDEQEM